MGAQTLESLPVGKDRFIGQLLLKLSRVALCVHQVEEGGIGVDLVTSADHCYFRVPIPLERQRIGEVSLVNPSALVGNALSLKAAELQCHV